MYVFLLVSWKVISLDYLLNDKRNNNVFDHMFSNYLPMYQYTRPRKLDSETEFCVIALFLESCN